MADEAKTFPPAVPPGGSDQTADKARPAAAGPAKAPVASQPPSPAGAQAPPRPPAPAAKPAGPAGAQTPPRPAPPPPKPVVKPEPWSSPLVEELQKKFPGAVIEALIFRDQGAVTLQKEAIAGVAEFLKSEEGGAYVYLTDQTAVDYPKREKRFEIVYHVYSFVRNDRLRLKILVGENEKAPSVTGVWRAANWMEREIFDMFGIPFEGHPDLKRILLPDGWTGHPLRKDYDILKQDQAWVQANLAIKSEQ